MSMRKRGCNHGVFLAYLVSLLYYHNHNNKKALNTRAFCYSGFYKPQYIVFLSYLVVVLLVCYRFIVVFGEFFDN